MDAKTKLCCLIGNPVEHSLSPLIHNTLAKRMNINLVYTAFKVESDNIPTVIKGADALGIIGMNVTVPHKCAVIPELAAIDSLAAKIGAVNTLVKIQGGYKGYNTDILGLDRELEENNIEIKNKDVIILGAGGASKAITFLCAQKGASRIWLLNRSLDKAVSLANEVNSYFGNVVEPLLISEYYKIPKAKYPVIQTTSVGLFPNVDEQPVSDGFYDYVGAAVDIIFNPEETLFMKKSRAKGAPSYNGLQMLLYQGIAAFELWNNVKVSKELSDEVLEILKKEMASR